MKIVEQQLGKDCYLATLSELSRRTRHVAEYPVRALKQTLGDSSDKGLLVTQSGLHIPE
jgi:hypothetical protein